MKKILIGTCLLAMMYFVATPMAFADETSHSDPSTTVTLTIDTSHVLGAVQNFTFGTSPNVCIYATTNGTAYAISAANTKTDQNNGLEYGTLSTATGYAQKTKTTGAGSGAAYGPEATTSPADLPGGSTSWAWMGGSGASGS